MLLHSRNPLKMGVYIKREDNTNLRIYFKYEHLSDLCFDYTRLGHSAQACDNSMSHPGSENGRKYRPQIQANALNSPSISWTNREENRTKNSPQEQKLKSTIRLIMEVSPEPIAVTFLTEGPLYTFPCDQLLLAKRTPLSRVESECIQ